MSTFYRAIRIEKILEEEPLTKIPVFLGPHTPCLFLLETAPHIDQDVCTTSELENEVENPRQFESNEDYKLPSKRRSVMHEEYVPPVVKGQEETV